MPLVYLILYEVFAPLIGVFIMIIGALIMGVSKNKNRNKPSLYKKGKIILIIGGISIILIILAPVIVYIFYDIYYKF